MHVRVDNLVRVFDGPPRRVALDGVDLDLSGPGVHAIIGPNGAGKTSLLRLLALLDRPEGGTIRFDDRPVVPCRSDRLRVTMLFDRPALLRGTVRSNLRFALRVHGASRAEAGARIADLTGSLALERILDARVDRISAGEARRAALARVLSLRTDLLLLDEPTANLDPLSAGLIERTIRETGECDGRLIVLATHDLSLARRLARHAHFLVGGRIRQGGDAAEVLDSPGSRELAEFLGTENLFRGTIENRGDRQVFVAPGLTFAVASERTGPAFAAFSARDVLISFEEVRSSAMNSVRGTIERTEERGPLVLITSTVATADEGARVRLRAAVTRATLAAMDLRPGKDVVLTFKATAVRLFDV